MDGLFFNHFHAQVRDNRTNRAAHGTSVNLFVGCIVVNEKTVC